MNWFQNHLKTIVTAASVTGTVLAVVAANTTGLLPQTVGAWLASAGAIILGTIAALTGEPVVRGVQRKLVARKEAIRAGRLVAFGIDPTDPKS